MNKIRWVVYETGDEANYVEVYENNQWVHYTKSRIYKPDLSDFDGVKHSRGFPTFQNGIKLGYIVDIKKSI